MRTVLVLAVLLAATSTADAGFFRRHKGKRPAGCSASVAVTQTYSATVRTTGCSGGACPR